MKKLVDFSPSRLVAIGSGLGARGQEPSGKPSTG
jgi:hypothetical protein